MSADGTRLAVNEMLSAASPSRSKFSRELVLVLVIKFLLIVAIKLVFFSHPVSKNEVLDRLDKTLAMTEEVANTKNSLDSLRDRP